VIIIGFLEGGSVAEVGGLTPQPNTINPTSTGNELPDGGHLDKLRTMASLHAAQGTFVGDFEVKQHAVTARDADLIDRAFKLGLIDGLELTELNAIRALRNRHRHPTSASPDREMALHALRRR